MSTAIASLVASVPSNEFRKVCHTWLPSISPESAPWRVFCDVTSPPDRQSSRVMCLLTPTQSMPGFALTHTHTTLCVMATCLTCAGQALAAADVTGSGVLTPSAFFAVLRRQAGNVDLAEVRGDAMVIRGRIGCKLLPLIQFNFKTLFYFIVEEENE